MEAAETRASQNGPRTPLERRDLRDLVWVPGGLNTIVLHLDQPDTVAEASADVVLLPERVASRISNVARESVVRIAIDGEEAQEVTVAPLESVTPAIYPPEPRSRFDLPTGFATRAFQFPSLQHLDLRVSQAREDCVRIEGLSPKYARSMGEAYASFRKFLVAKKAEDFFIGGDFQRQQHAIREWAGWLHDRDTKRNAINTFFRSLRAVVIRIAERDSMTNPFFRITAPKPERNRIVRSLPRESVIELQNYVRDCDWKNSFERARNLAIMTLFTPGGLRREDVKSLTCGDVDIERGIIHIRAGKGTNGGKDRDVMMSDEMRDILAAYLIERRTAGKTTTAFIASVTRDWNIGDSTLKDLFKKLEQGTGIHTSPHPLRHSAVVVLGRNRIPPRQIADQMGWASVRMLDRYGNVFDDDRATAMRRVRIDASFDDAPQ